MFTAGTLCLQATQFVFSPFTRYRCNNMQLKDYYKTLEISPLATALQIKKSFRQLALQHHPDKNPGNVVAEARFREIQEAYEILSNPGKREEYNYKRWYNRSIREAFVNEALTPGAIAAECTRLTNYLQSVNAMRIDYDALSYHIRQLLSDKNIGILLQFNNKESNTLIIQQLLLATSLLPFQYIVPVAGRLQRLAGNNAMQLQQLADFVQQQKTKNNWQKYRIALVLTVTLLLCWLIYWLSN